MLRCPSCGETIKTPERSQSAVFRHFRGALTTWEQLFQQAAAFASSIGPQRLISISHSEDYSDGVVTVWYWTDE